MRPAAERLPIRSERVHRAVGRRDQHLLARPLAAARERGEERRRLAAAADAGGEGLQEVGIVVHVERATRLADAARRP
jgi:hypothetical protein